MILDAVRVCALGLVLVAACSTSKVEQGPNAAKGMLDGKEFLLRSAVYIEEGPLSERLVLSDDEDVCKTFAAGVIPPGTMWIEVSDVFNVERTDTHLRTEAKQIRDTCKPDEPVDWAIAYKAKTYDVVLTIDDSGSSASPRMYGSIDISWTDGSHVAGEFKAVPCTSEPAEDPICG